MADKEEKEEIKITEMCSAHKYMLNTSWPDPARRMIVQSTQACMLTVFMMGKGHTTEEEIAEELKDQKCPNCYWDNLIWMAVGLLEGLGLPIKTADIQEIAVEDPKPNIWKN